MSLRDVIALIIFYSLIWVAVAFGIYSVARAVIYIPYSDILLVGSAQAIGYFAALVTLVAPAGLGVRDAAFAWAVKAALPSRSFAVGSLISIAVRGVMTVGEVIYVALVTTVGRRQGWTIHTGILHPSQEETEPRPRKRRGPHPRNPLGDAGRRTGVRTWSDRDAGAELEGGEGEEEGDEQAVAGDGGERQRPEQVPGEEPEGGEEEAGPRPGGARIQSTPRQVRTSSQTIAAPKSASAATRTVPWSRPVSRAKVVGIERWLVRLWFFPASPNACSQSQPNAR